MRDGQTIAHYTILGKIGQGGMGVVYRARDPRLDRLVAVKVLPADKTMDPERRRRFVQEAKSASALNHPNIVTIYDIGTFDGQDFISMEYVEGKTLGERIGAKGLKVNAALDYAVQLADALGKAHAAGIIHRDLKPSNIMVTGEDRIKVLDFGLAKLIQPQVDEFAPTEDFSADNRLHTQEGAIVGTAAYMSPEQAQGKPVDARSDIFSFGAVLYEMLTGRPAFRRDSNLLTLAAIVQEEPPSATEIAGPLPSEIQRVLSRCLSKDPQRRWQNMSDLKVVLQDLKEEYDSGKLPAVEVLPRQAKRHLLIPAAAVAVGLGVVAILTWWLLQKPAAVGPLPISKFTFDAGLTSDPVISRDGKLAAYASDRSGDGNLDIWVQQISSRQAIRLTRHETDDHQPSFSPDGARIAFRSERDGGAIYLIDTLGGTEQKLTDGGWRPRFSPDGSWILYTDASISAGPGLNRIFLIPAQGGEAKPFQPDYRMQVSPGAVTVPIWSPDGKQVLFDGQKVGAANSRDWWVAPVDGGPPISTGAIQTIRNALSRSIPANRAPSAWTGNEIIFFAGTTIEGVNLFRIPIDPLSFRISKTPEPLTSGPGMKIGASIANDGTMLFPNLSWVLSIWEVGLDSRLGISKGEARQLTQDTLGKGFVSISRDGSRLAYTAWTASRSEIHLLDLPANRERIISGIGGITFLMPILSPDGKTLVYRNWVDGQWIAYVLSGEEVSGRSFCKGCQALGVFSDPDQAVVRYNEHEFVRLHISSGERVSLVKASDGVFNDAAISPDDNWLAFTAKKSDGRVVLYVSRLGQPASAEGDWITVAEDARYLGSPRWSANGDFIYYLTDREGRACIWAQRLDARTKRPAGAPFPAFHAHRGRYFLNNPPGSGSIAVARDRLVYVASEMTANIWMTRLDRK